MINTHGLTHIALQVANLEISFRFYEQLFGAKMMYQTPEFIQFQTPGSNDIIVLQKRSDTASIESGILHFGFRLQQPVAPGLLTDEVLKAGGRVKETGEFVPGEPYIFCYDPDGYEVEIWYENIPPGLTGFN